MTKYSYSLLVCCVLLFSGCQSIEQLSIDYMLPAEVSFPSALRRVAVVNNMPPIPDNKLILEENDEKKKDETEIARKTKYFNGDGKIATESLAEALANENYFDEVIICDSALRAHDMIPRESTLSKEEVEKLTQSLGADLLIALENVQMRSIRKIEYLPEWGVSAPTQRSDGNNQCQRQHLLGSCGSQYGTGRCRTHQRKRDAERGFRICRHYPREPHAATLENSFPLSLYRRFRKYA